ncbi:MAG: alkaline phosphatase family protein [Candidatus Heimdallarchaeota archaeon]
MDETAFPLKPLPDRDDLYYPDLDLNISKVVPTALSLLGMDFAQSKILNKYLEQKEGWKIIKKSKISKAIVLVLDALGFEHFMRYSLLLKDCFKRNGVAISSVFPTITSTCMVTIHQGSMPIKHGIVGQKIRFNEIGNIVDTLTLRTKDTRFGDLTTAGVKVKSFLWEDFLLNEDNPIIGIDLIEDHIANSGLSHLLHEHPHSIGYSSHVDCFAAAQRILETPTDHPLLLKIYIGSIDSISHRYTTESQALEDEIRSIEELLFNFLKRLDSKIASETAIFITADHGQEILTSDKKIVVTIEEEEYLKNILEARGKSGRVTHLFSRTGKHEEVVQWFKEKIGDNGVILTPEQYPDFMGKGANSSKVIDRIGDVQVVLGKNAAIFFGHSGDYDPIFHLGLNATHGSLSRNELVVPLLFGRIDDLVK